MALDAIGIVSRDLNKSADFYRYLGVDLKAVGGDTHYEGSTPSGIRIMLDLCTEVKPHGSGVVLCFLQTSPKLVDETFAKITKAGFKSVKEPWDAFWGQRYASVLDPDGNQIDLFAAL